MRHERKYAGNKHQTQKQKRELELKHRSMWDALVHSTVTSSYSSFISFLPASFKRAPLRLQSCSKFFQVVRVVSCSASRHATGAAVLKLHQLVWLTEISRSNEAGASNAGPV